MSSVTPSSDGGYQFYAKRLSELEDELTEESKRTKAKRDQEVKDLEAAYEKERTSLSEKNAAALLDAKSKGNEALSHERERANAELDRLRSQTYDKFGKVNSEQERTKREMDEVQVTANARVEAEKAQSQRKEEQSARIAADRERDHARQLKEQAEVGRESAMTAYNNLSSEVRDGETDYRRELKKIYERLQNDTNMERAFERRNSLSAVRETQADADHLKGQTERAHEAMVGNLQKTYNEKSNRDAEHEKSSRNLEVGDLQKRLQTYAGMDKEMAVAKAKGRAEAFNEVESFFRAREGQLMDANQHLQQKARRDLETAEMHYETNNERSLRDKDDFLGRSIQEVNRASDFEKKNLVRAYENETGQLKQQMKSMKNSNSDRVERAILDANQQSEEALLAQQMAAQESLKIEKKNSVIERGQIEAKLQKIKNTADPSEISSLAAQNIEQTISGEYQKAFETEQKRNQGAQESMKTEFTTRYQDALQKSATRETQSRQMMQGERDLDRSDSSRTMEELRQQELVSRRNLEKENLHQQEKITKSYAKSLQGQQRKFDEIFADTKMSADEKIAAIRQEAEFNSRVQTREFNSKLSEQMREAARKLENQRLDYEQMLEDAKESANKALAESDRRAQKLMEETAKSYEHQIKEMEQAQKERERYVNATYQDQLEKVRAANARLINKKS